MTDYSNMWWDEAEEEASVKDEVEPLRMIFPAVKINGKIYAVIKGTQEIFEFDGNVLIRNK